MSILQNVGRVRTNGVDASATLRFGPHLSVYNALSYNSSKYRDNYVSGTTTVPTADKYVPNTAKWLEQDGGCRSMTARSRSRRSAIMSARASPPIPTTSRSAALPAEPAGELQPAAVDRFGVKDLKLSVNVTNVTNRKGIYELVVGAASKTWNSYAQPPRMGFITLSGAF